MLGWGVMVLVGMIVLMPFILWVAIWAVYRWVPLTDRGLAAVYAAIFSIYFAAMPILAVALAGAPILDLLLWGTIGIVFCFAIAYPLSITTIPTMQYLLRNIPRAVRNRPSSDQR